MSKELKERIKKLEEALISAGLPCQEVLCQCCRLVSYIPRDHDDGGRCESCLSSCYWSKGSKEWVKGSMCPFLGWNE